MVSDDSLLQLVHRTDVSSVLIEMPPRAVKDTSHQAVQHGASRQRDFIHRRLSPNLEIGQEENAGV